MKVLHANRINISIFLDFYNDDALRDAVFNSQWFKRCDCC